MADVRGTLSGTTSTVYGAAMTPTLYRSLQLIRRHLLYGYVVSEMSTQSQKVSSAA